MGRKTTIPTLYDQCTILSTNSLVQGGYLKKRIEAQGQIKWIKNGYEIQTILFTVNTINNYVELDYSLNGIQMNYKVYLDFIQSNLNNGIVYFFICPLTGIRCRKLHLFNGTFRHRSSFEGLYLWQVYGKKDRALCRILDVCKIGERAFDNADKKYFKKLYRGKPTRKYVKLLNQIREFEQYDKDVRNQLMINGSSLYP